MPPYRRRNRTRRRNSDAAITAGARPPPARNPFPRHPFPRPPPDAGRQPFGQPRPPSWPC